MGQLRVLFDRLLTRKVFIFHTMPAQLILDRLKVLNPALAVLRQIIEKLLVLPLRLDLIEA